MERRAALGAPAARGHRIHAEFEAAERGGERSSQHDAAARLCIVTGLPS